MSKITAWILNRSNFKIFQIYEYIGVFKTRNEFND